MERLLDRRGKRRVAHARVKLAVLVALVLVLAPAGARAGGAPGDEPDATHGRFAGDLGVVGSVGATFGPRAPRATVDLRLRYLSTAGVFVTYEDGPLVGSTAEPRRALAFGFELRPLFLGRWGTDRETGNARVDLLVDSLALELGAVFVQPEGARFGARPGIQTGLGAELPIFASASGPLIGVHGGVRWSDAALSGGPLDGPSDRALYLTVSVGWQQIFGAHVVDLGDRSKTAK